MSKLFFAVSSNSRSINTIVDVAAVEFRFGSIILVEKLIFDATNEKVGVARSHFGTHSDTVDSFVVVIGKQKAIKCQN